MFCVVLLLLLLGFFFFFSFLVFLWCFTSTETIRLIGDGQRRGGGVLGEGTETIVLKELLEPS